MGLGLLRALRICLVLFASIFFILVAIDMGLDQDYKARYWITWVSLFFAIYAGIAYGWALKAQAAKRNIIKPNCTVWLLFRRYGVLFYPQHACGERACSFEFFIEFFGFSVGILIFLELIFAYRYERSFKALKKDTEATHNIIVSPAPVPSAPLSGSVVLARGLSGFFMAFFDFLEMILH
ncbi:hypothetical protein BGX34_005968 [Mortierella sp. NVP85]|nr:hypothetical protein BGX34_005968 [Mortierella sp. NVP85]